MLHRFAHLVGSLSLSTISPRLLPPGRRQGGQEDSDYERRDLNAWEFGSSLMEAMREERPKGCTEMVVLGITMAALSTCPRALQ